ncbi:MAG: site-specific integrase [Spirochaetales bacterium]|nr:site-specific integrase [Spirochaetales bacterium]
MNLYKRGNVWQAAFYTGPKTPPYRISTKQTDEKAARAWAKRKFLELQKPPERRTSWIEATKFWWTQECPYCKEAYRNGRVISACTIGHNRSMLDRYCDCFAALDITDIKPYMVDDWKYWLVEKQHLSPKSANTYLSALNVMFDYWWRRDLIPENPCKKVKRYHIKKSTPRGIMTPEEVQRLFSDIYNWKSPEAYLANILSASTAMRMGEIQALRPCDIQPGKITCACSWCEDLHILKETKTGVVREIPISDGLYDLLMELPREPEEFIFCSPYKETPITRSYILGSLYAAMDKIGIGPAERKSRRITFHSWRHYLNSRLRLAGLPDVLTQEITGHATQEMTERYTHITYEDALRALPAMTLV